MLYAVKIQPGCAARLHIPAAVLLPGFSVFLSLFLFSFSSVKFSVRVFFSLQVPAGLREFLWKSVCVKKSSEESSLFWSQRCFISTAFYHKNNTGKEHQEYPAFCERSQISGD